MGAVTYPDPAVQQYVREHFVPVKFDVVEHPEAMLRFNTPWTPTLLVQDPEGREHRRSQGFLDARRFLAEMGLARLVSAINLQFFGRAHTLAREARILADGDPQREPEALYWGSVAAYKATGDSANLLSGWTELLDDFPASDWARKVEFLRY